PATEVALAEIDETPESNLVRRGQVLWVDRNISAAFAPAGASVLGRNQQQPGFNARDVHSVFAGGPDVMVPSGCHDSIPDRGAVLARDPELIAMFAGEALTRDRDAGFGDPGAADTGKGEVRPGFTGRLLQDHARARALQ